MEEQPGSAIITNREDIPEMIQEGSAIKVKDTAPDETYEGMMFGQIN